MKTIKASAEMYALGGITLQQLEEVCGGTVPQAVMDYVKAYGAEYDAHVAHMKAQADTKMKLFTLESYIRGLTPQEYKNRKAMGQFKKSGIKFMIDGCSVFEGKAIIYNSPEMEECTEPLKVGDVLYVIHYKDLIKQ